MPSQNRPKTGPPGLPIKDETDRAVNHLANTSEANIPGLQQIAEELLREFGGPKGLAAKYKKTYESATTSEATKSRMLQDVMRVITMAGGGKNTDPLGTMTDAELKAVLAEVMKGEPAVTNVTVEQGTSDGNAEKEVQEQTQAGGVSGAGR